jgi:hypothetical protein
MTAVEAKMHAETPVVRREVPEMSGLLGSANSQGETS